MKELRLAGISTLENGNVFLLQFLADFNRRFAKEPLNSKDVHLPFRADECLMKCSLGKRSARSRLGSVDKEDSQIG